VKDAFAEAQVRSLGLLAEVVGALRAGVDETQCVRLAMRGAEARGFVGFFRPPVVRFEPTASRFTLPRKRALAPGMRVEIVLLPATRHAFGHVAVTLPFDAPADPLADGARETCRAVLGFANRTKTAGELHVFAKSWANNHRLRLIGRSIGFHAATPEGALAVSWPRGAWARTLLRRYQLEHLNPRAVRGLYAVRPRVALGDAAASFGELLLVDGDEKAILGRDSLDDVGRLAPR
jgi:hypothetical protein